MMVFSDWTQVGGDIDGAVAGEQSGKSVSLSSDGNIVAIGGHGPLNAVRIYQFDEVNWNQLGVGIDPQIPHNNCDIYVNLNDTGHILAIGAVYITEGFYVSENVKVYQYDGVDWNQLGNNINQEAAGDAFGRAISLNSDGTRIAIGAPGNDGGGAYSGHVRVYEFDGLDWIQLGTDIDGTSHFGSSISLSSDGNRMAVGSWGNRVRIYQFDGINWNQLGSNIDGEAAGDWAGSDSGGVSLNSDGSIIAIGSPGSDANGDKSGQVRVFQFDGVDWNQLGSNINGEAGDYNYWAPCVVSLSGEGSILAIGAGANSGNGNASGCVRIFQFDGVNWVQVGADIDGEAMNDQSGFSVSLSSDGSRVAIGARFNDGNGLNSGHVRVFNNSSLSLYTQIPDANFEQALINLGIDTEATLDGQVLTADIAGITSLDVSNENITDLTGIEVFMALETLHCQNNQLVALDFSQNLNLTELYCYTNQLTTLDVTQNVNLIYLQCQINQLANLDMTQSVNLTQLRCSDNQLTESLLLNGLNVLTDFNATNNPGLSCIQVDSAANANAGVGIYINWQKDGTAGYSEGCGYTAIPDSNFEQTLINLGIDTEATLDGQVLTADIEGITSLDVSSQNIADLTGIEGFTALEALYCNNNQLTTLDVTQNTNLTDLRCYYNQLAVLDITQNTSLQTLYCSYNQLTALDVTQNTSLQTLYCNNNELAALDVTQNTNLTRLYCHTNQLAALDVTQNTSLTWLICHTNQLAALNVTQNTSLQALYCSYNQLTALDVAQNTSLQTLYCDNNELAALNVTQNTNLIQLYCHTNQLAALDVTQNTNLTRLYCHTNQLAALNVTQNTNITRLYCDNNQLSGNLLLNGLNALIHFNAASNPDLSCVQVDNATDADAGVDIYTNWQKDVTANYSESCPSLYTAIPDANFEQALINLGVDTEATLDGQVLTADIEGITSLDISNQNIADLTGIEGFTALETLYCYNNQLIDLDITQNTNLTDLRCYNNQLATLDVTQNTDLTHLDCYHNQLAALDVSQNPNLTLLSCGSNQLTTLDVTQNPNLTHLLCYDNQLTSLLTANAALTHLLCYNNQLAVLDVTQDPDLSHLQCHNNLLTALGVTQNANLSLLHCYNNPLNALDVTQNVNLVILHCYDNQLMALDLTQNTALTTLDCHSNQLTALDITLNSNLSYLYCHNNALSNLITQNSNAVVIHCYDNQLTALDVSQNSNLTWLYCYNNPGLSCIQVANETDANAGTGIYANWQKDAGTNYSENCGG